MDSRAKCYKKRLEGWPGPKLPALQGSGGSAPHPRWDCQQPAARYGEHLFPHGPFSPFQQYSEQPWRLGEGSSLAEQRVG